MKEQNSLYKTSDLKIESFSDEWTLLVMIHKIATVRQPHFLYKKTIWVKIGGG